MKPKKFLIFKHLFLLRVQVSYKLFLIKKNECMCGSICVGVVLCVCLCVCLSVLMGLSWIWVSVSLLYVSMCVCPCVIFFCVYLNTCVCSVGNLRPLRLKVTLGLHLMSNNLKYRTQGYIFVRNIWSNSPTLRMRA